MADDTAAPGKSALLAVILRRADVEAAKWRGRCDTQLLFDVAAFFDSVQIPTLAEMVKQEPDFPVDTAVLAMTLHRVCRRILSNGAVSEPVRHTGKSLLAGCSSSTSLARLYLKKAIKDQEDKIAEQQKQIAELQAKLQAKG